MDKIDRDDAAEPGPVGEADGPGHFADEDEVTAPVIADAEGGSGVHSSVSGDFQAASSADARRPPREDSGRPPPPDEDALPPGYILRDRFEIVELVHSGGMGHVYKALDNRRQRSTSEQVHVAIKMMRRTLTPEFDARMALEREAARTQQLSHPNIVNIYDFDQHEDQCFIVMEWLDGESLNALLRRTTGRPIAFDFAWRIVEGAASGLRHAHSHDVVHADINPSNIFITDTLEIKLLDFGVARHANSMENHPEDDIVWATHTYASPEVLTGLPPGFEDDIFSLGCVAYRALTGRHPFGSKPSTIARQEQMILQPVPGLADSYWQVLKRSLSYERSDRPASVSAFFVERRATDAEAVKSPPRGRVRMYAASALVLASVALIAGYLWVGRDDSTAAAPAVVDMTAVESTEGIEPAAPPEPSATEQLLAGASRAIEESRYVEPESDNARAMYREVLALEPENALALAGLREISNVYVQQAEFALRDDDPDSAVAAHAVAGETDPGNPALVILSELFAARANGALANAGVASAEGDFERAGELLSEAERYGVLEPGILDEARDRTSRSQYERSLLDALAAVEVNVAAGRLIAPPGNNAHQQLLDLQRSDAAEPRVLAAAGQLVERLLNSAADAATAGQFPDAREMLDAAAELGVLEAEIASARASLDRTVELAAAPAESSAEGPGNEPVAAAGDSPMASSGDGETSAREPTPAAQNADPVPGGAESTASAASAAIADAESQQQLVPFSELNIENFVAPLYPRRASTLNVSGSVDLRFEVNPDGSTGNIEVVASEPRNTFVLSAVDAVQQWRFAERENVAMTRVRLRFDPDAPE